jgi:hypothetical protein
MEELHKITGISILALQGSPFSRFSVDERMSWAADRKTKREEDGAYSLLGMFWHPYAAHIWRGRRKRVSPAKERD